MNEITMDLDLIEKKKVLIATPMYGGVAQTDYMLSMLELFRAPVNNKIEFQICVTKTESLITRARNNLVDIFLDEDFDYLFFIDSDISFNVFDAVYMIYLAATTDKEVITASYPLKEINWKNIITANSLGLINNKEDYKKFSSKYVTHFIETGEVNALEPIKVLESGTGFMLIKRNVFEKFKNAYPEQQYIAEEINKEKVAYFDCIINKEDKRYLSEDYMFCNYVRKIGIDIWLIPWIKLQHIGQYEYSGSMKDFLEMNYKAINNNVKLNTVK